MQKVILGTVLIFNFELLIFNCTFAAGTTGASVLQENIGARSLGMAEAFVAVADDFNSIWYNPAGLASINSKEASSTGIKGLSDIFYGFLGYAQPVRKIGVLGGGITFLRGGKIELNYPDKPSETKTAQQDYLLTFTWGRNLTKRIMLGTNLKFLHTTLMEEAKGFTFAGDVGLLYKRESLSFGLSGQNMGPKIIYKGGLSSGEEGEALPLTVRFGTGYRRGFGTGHKLITAIDMVIFPYEIGKEFDFAFKNSDIKFHFGCEYWWQHRLAVRAGYKFGYALDSFSFGFGYIFSKYQLDYALGLMGDLGLTHRFSLSICF